MTRLSRQNKKGKDLAAKAGLDANNASNKDWANWINKNKLDPAELSKQVNPSGRVDSTSYQKAKWDDVQGYVGGDTADQHYGDSLHIVAEIVQVSKSTDQSDGNKGFKQTYDIDNGQRYASHAHLSPSIRRCCLTVLRSTHSPSSSSVMPFSVSSSITQRRTSSAASASPSRRSFSVL